MYINNLGHMTKMATMPIYGKNPSIYMVRSHDQSKSNFICSILGMEEQMYI